MKSEQRIIANWMLGVMERHNLSAQDWAKTANIAPTSVSRAVREDYKSVTTISVLHKLARAAGEPSVLDFLAES